MDFKVTFLETFIDDLEGIVREVAVENPMAARKLGEAIVNGGEALSFFA